MCQRKPGPRCSNHVQEQVLNTQSRFKKINEESEVALKELHEVSSRSEVPSKDLAYKVRTTLEKEKEAARAYHEACHQFEATPAGIKALEKKVEQQSDVERQAYKDFLYLPPSASSEERDDADARAQEESVRLKGLLARLKDARRHRFFDTEALKNEKKRENAQVRTEAALDAGDKEAFEREISLMSNDYNPQIDIQAMRREREFYTTPGGLFSDHGRIYDLNLPHGGTAQVSVVKEATEEGNVCRVSVAVTPKNKFARGDTRQGFGNYIPTYEKGEEATFTFPDLPPGQDYTGRGGKNRHFESLAKSGLRQHLMNLHQAHCADLKKRFEERTAK